jgi:hypothetical protein
VDVNPYEPSRIAEPLGQIPVAHTGSPTEVEFDLTVEDFIAFNHDHVERMFAMRTTRVVLALFVGLTVPVGVAFYWMSNDVAADAAPFVILWAVVHFLGFVAVAIWWSRRSSSWGSGWIYRWLATRGDTSAIFGRYRFVISPREILERSPKAEAHYDISVVQKIIATATHAFIYVSPLQAFIIPRRAFVPVETFDAFLDTLGRLANRPIIRA